MSLINLSRSTQPAKRSVAKAVSADDFIQEAVEYANGNVVPIKSIVEASDTTKVEALPEVADDIASDNAAGLPMRRATFTLTEECIVQLSQISEQSGIARSKLIRLWIQRFAHLQEN